MQKYLLKYSKTPLKYIIVGANINIFLRALPPEKSQQPLPTKCNVLLVCNVTYKKIIGLNLNHVEIWRKINSF